MESSFVCFFFPRFSCRAVSDRQFFPFVRQNTYTRSENRTRGHHHHRRRRRNPRLEKRLAPIVFVYTTRLRRHRARAITYNIYAFPTLARPIRIFHRNSQITSRTTIVQ